jgi:hypothetical protein
MKTKTFLFFLTAIPLALLTGCAQLGPVAVSPAVYKSSRDAMVSQNQLRKEEAETGRANEKLVQEMTGEWKNVALSEIQGKVAGGTDSSVRKTVDKDGVLGGSECVFINESPRDKIIIATKRGGFMNGQRFNIPVERNARTVFKLPTGDYSYVWLVKDVYYTYFGGGPRNFPVTAVPHYFDNKLNKNFHGGVLLFD